MMRITVLLAFAFCLAPAILAQTALKDGELTDVLVVKHTWAKERINWERDPFGGTTESFDDMRRRAADDKRLQTAKATGNIAEANRIQQEARAEQVIKARPPAPPRYVFIYKVVVKNSGLRSIKAVDWDYVFFDVETGEEVGRQEFTSEERIGAGKNRELSVMVSSPPSKTISVYALEKNEKKSIKGEVILVRITYEDGTVWQRPDKSSPSL